jgi:hypothetical protein
MKVVMVSYLPPSQDWLKWAELHLMRHSADSRKWCFRSSAGHLAKNPAAVRQA